MDRRLRMTAEIGDWLAEIGDAQSAVAVEVGAALVAVLQTADPAGLPLLGEPTAPRFADPREAVDYAYQQLLEELQLIRRSVADVATTRKRADLRLGVRRDSGADASEIAELERELAAEQQREVLVAQLSQQVQADVDAFRTAKESAKAMYTAAEARLRIAETVEAAGGEPDADLAQLREDLRAAAQKLGRLAANRRPATEARERISETHHERTVPRTTERPTPPQPPPAAGLSRPQVPQAAAQPVPGLLELHADPLGSDIRVLLAIEPADTVTLLAVLEGPEAVIEHGAEAIRLAGKLLAKIRADGWPTEIDDLEFADADAFLARFFPADDGSVTSRARGLAATVPLRTLRTDLHLTLAEVAGRSGLAAHRVAAIEREGLRSARLHEAIALARALGARLDLPGGPGPVLGR